MLEEFGKRVERLKLETYGLYLAARDPRTPWYVKFVVAGIVAYALSPVDLIPDFIPIVGYLDDILLLPVLITLAIKLTPTPVLAECRIRAQEAFQSEKPVSRAAGVVIVSLWLMGAGLISYWIYELTR